jgi:hypothetical protein
VDVAANLWNQRPPAPAAAVDCIACNCMSSVVFSPQHDLIPIDYSSVHRLVSPAGSSLAATPCMLRRSSRSFCHNWWQRLTRCAKGYPFVKPQIILSLLDTSESDRHSFEPWQNHMMTFFSRFLREYDGFPLLVRRCMYRERGD